MTRVRHRNCFAGGWFFWRLSFESADYSAEAFYIVSAAENDIRIFRIERYEPVSTELFEIALAVEHENSELAALYFVRAGNEKYIAVLIFRIHAVSADSYRKVGELRCRVAVNIDF